MSAQKTAILQMVEAARQRRGRRVGEVLATLGIKRATYYRWKKGVGGRSSSPGGHSLTPAQHSWIDEMKDAHPEYRHRRIQGLLQAEGCYVSASAVYAHLKKRGQVEPYVRREAPWKQPRYEIRHRNLLWGTDWAKLSIGMGGGICSRSLIGSPGC